VNKITFTANLTKDSELRYTQDSKAVLGFDCANNQGYGDNQHTEYYQCSVWGARAEKLSEYLTKATKVVVHGEHRTEKREHNGKTFFNNKVFVNEIEFMSSGNGQSQGGQQQAPQQSQQPAPSGGGANDFDDDIPF